MLRDEAERAARGLPVYPIDERFLASLARLPPSAGNALGFDRLVMLACGESTVGSVMTFSSEEV
jgi:lysyl-tRNA synthetase class 2